MQYICKLMLIYGHKLEILRVVDVYSISIRVIRKSNIIFKNEVAHKVTLYFLTLFSGIYKFFFFFHF